ncbi:ligase-associated DNA damage response endonuclease PdeM [Synechococcus sp. UW179A]|uniref:ligase-associated DNA damage response endonuclease PdeM n=1 Tax=Synechococcus sp. UW179A TaxID=2575510 RepID=UPI00210F5A1E|nr:ligase-associated DNA damage response endonuclease PdeM [Synechococcus sp. UW179A]
MTAINAEKNSDQADGEPTAHAPNNVAHCRWQWRDEELVLLAQKAIWRPSGEELFVADLHLGKAEVFQACGIPLPSDDDRSTLLRLEKLCQQWKPTRVIVLGDLIHGPLGLTERLRADLRTLHNRLNAEVLLIGGNHDRHLHPDAFPQHPAFRLGELWLSHEPEQPMDGRAGLNLCGHIHPTTTLSQGSDRLKLPCFAYDNVEQRMLIPAFGELTGGHDCRHRYRKWLVAEGTIVPWLDNAQASNGSKVKW